MLEATARSRFIAQLDVARNKLLAQQRALVRLTQAVTELPLNQALRELTLVAASELGVARVSVWRFDAVRESIVCADLFERAGDRHTCGASLAVANYPGYFRALEARDVVAAEDARTDPRTCEFLIDYLAPLGIGAMLDAPIVLDSELAGVLCCEHLGGGREWLLEEQLFAVALANVAALILERERRARAESDLAAAGADLRWANQRLELALEASTIALWDSDQKTQRVRLSDEWAVMLGLPRGPTETSVQGLVALVHPEDRAALASAARRALVDPAGTYAVEHRVRTVTGEWRWILSRGRVTERDPQTGEALRLVGTNVDITEEKNEELDERETEAERFRMLTELSSDGYWEQDEQFRFTFVSGAAHINGGVAGEALVGRARWDLPALNMTPEAWDEHRALLERHEPFQDLELHRTSVAGPTGWFAVSGRPVFDRRGGFRGYRGVIRDITPRKFEEQRRLAAAAQQRDALVREVHHRIKNNLQGIAGLLQSSVERADVAALRDAINQIQVIAKVHGLRGRAPDHLYLNSLLTEIVATLQPVASAPIRLTMEGAATDWTLPDLESVPIALVLNELVWNAAKHSSPAAAGVDVSLRTGDGVAVITIDNRGVLPAGFAASGSDTSLGLGLVAALLPPQGATFTLVGHDDGVRAELRLVAPIIEPGGPR